MRKKLIAANWKMNPPPEGWQKNDSPYKPHPAVDVVIFPSFLDIWACLQRGMTVGGQTGRADPMGAFTGDVSMKMLKDLGCSYVLCGHSERRQYHGETDDDVSKQATAALEVGLIPVACIGETLNERELNQQKEVVERQIKALPEGPDIVIAYEPVWAIGTGRTAFPADAQQMHAFIRSLLPESERDIKRIVYGGSLKAENAQELLAQEDIDGGLIGGASLQTDEFKKIVEIAVALSS